MPEFPYRLATIDLDDTLLGPDKRISPQNALAIRHLVEDGVEVVLASGRRYENMERYVEELDLAGAIITAQGALALRLSDRKELYRAFLKPADAREIIREGLARDLTVLAYLPDHTYSNVKNDLTDLYDRRSGDSGVVLTDMSLLSGPVMKILWLAEPSEIPPLATWATQARPDLHTVATDPEYLEWLDWDANKARALDAVSAELGIPRESVVAFGDGNNDAQMLEWAGHGVAMAHGSQMAHAAADEVGPVGNPETALARSIEALFRRSLRHS